MPRHWTFVSDQRSAWYGFSLAAGGDINGDGLPDLIVGVPRFAENGFRSGGFAVFMGNREGLKETPTAIFRGAWRDVRFGDILSGIVDVNGDGLGDLVTAAPSSVYPESLDACVFQYHGTADGLQINRATKLCAEMPSHPRAVRVTDAGDLNGDGIQDILVGVGSFVSNSIPIFWPVYGSATGLAWQVTLPFTIVGSAFASAGDVNGDGFADVIVGRASFDGDDNVRGQATVHYGSPSGLHSTAGWSVQGSETYQRLGLEVAGIGDVNGDGFGDVAIGAPGLNPKRDGIGHVLIYFGSRGGLSTSPNWTATAERPSSLFGRSIAGAGDVNGDGCADFVISATYLTEAHNREGRVYLYLGSTNGPEQSPRLIIDGGLAEAQFGFALARAGDMDGDGLSDFLIGSPYYGNSPIQVGRVDLFYGSLEAYQKPLHLVAKGRRFERFAPESVVAAGESQKNDNKQTPASIGISDRPNGGIPWLVVTGALLVLGGVGLFAWNRQRVAVLRERERIARDLHDEVGAHLTSLTMLGKDVQSDTKRQEVSAAAREISRAFEQVVWAVRPDTATLEQLIAFLGAQSPKFFTGNSTRCFLDLPIAVPNRKVPDRVRQNLLPAVKEALNNAAKHAHASEVWLRIQTEGEVMRIVVEDNGCGLPKAGAKATPDADFASTSRGIANMKRRISEICGVFSIEERDGGGTRVVIQIGI